MPAYPSPWSRASQSGNAMEESTSQAASLPRSLVGQPIGSYRVIEPLGSGGMSTVFRAVHVETGHEVALKVLLGSLARNSTLLQRFLREARSRRDPGAPQYRGDLRSGRRPGPALPGAGVRPGRGFPRLCPAARAARRRRGHRGHPRRRQRTALRRRPGPDPPRHQAIQHPPHAQRASPRSSTWAWPSRPRFEDERVTREGTTVGTVDYMAPEQARDSRATSIQSDIYSLGCTFYYLLAGVPPFPGGDITDKLTRHARAPAPDIRDLRPDIPAGVAAILLRMMAKQPEDRFADYDELIAALDAVSMDDVDASPGIALMPLEDDEVPDRPRPSVETRATRVVARSPWNDGAEDALPARIRSRACRSTWPTSAMRTSRGRSRASRGRRCRGWVGRSRRRCRTSWMTSRNPNPRPSSPPGRIARCRRGSSPRRRSSPSSIPLVIGLIRILGGPGAAGGSSVEIPDPEADTFRPPVVVSSAPPPAFDTESRRSRAARGTRTGAIESGAAGDPEAVLGRAGGQGARTRRPGADLGRPQGIPTPPARMGPDPSVRTAPRVPSWWCVASPR